MFGDFKKCKDSLFMSINENISKEFGINFESRILTHG